MLRSRLPEPPPLETNDLIPVAAGTGVWAVALGLLLVFYDELPADQHWWVWTCVAGVAGGLFGLVYVWIRRRRRARRAETSSDTDGAPESDVGSAEAGTGGTGEPSQRPHSYSQPTAERDGTP